MRGLTAARAYQASARHRNFRDQEAEVFLRVNAVLRSAQRGDELSRAKAIADNDRLWTTTMDLMRDPGNKLPLPLRASILSVGFAVQRETAQDEPDLGFLIGINEQIAAGLIGS